MKKYPYWSFYSVEESGTWREGIKVRKPNKDEWWLVKAPKNYVGFTQSVSENEIELFTDKIKGLSLVCKISRKENGKITIKK